MNTILFIDQKGQQKSITVGDFCKVTLNIQDGNCVLASVDEKRKMEPVFRPKEVGKSLEKH